MAFRAFPPVLNSTYMLSCCSSYPCRSSSKERDCHLMIWHKYAQILNHPLTKTNPFTMDWSQPQILALHVSLPKFIKEYWWYLQDTLKLDSLGCSASVQIFNPSIFHQILGVKLPQVQKYPPTWRVFLVHLAVSWPTPWSSLWVDGGWWGSWGWISQAVSIG